MRRTLYTAVGYTLGLGTGWYVQRRVKRTVEKVAPEQVRAEVADRGRQAATRARDFAVDLRDAAQEGMATMRQERAALLAEFAADEAMHAGPARRLPGRADQGGATGGYRPRH